ncbi:MAG: MoaD/ThiS family protein [Spirochaetaceae bacterium]
MNTVLQVAAFGPLTDVLGSEPLEVSVPLPMTAASLREELIRRFPGLAGHRFRLAADERLMPEEASIAAAREIALLPPFAGG